MVGILKFFMGLTYFFFKLLPTRKKIVFISRQSDAVPLDFQLLGEEISLRDNDVKIVFLCKRMRSSLSGYFSYLFTLIDQMFHLATSRVCILDSYCIPVSLLTHKSDLFILQLWHAIGKMKKSGHQTIEKRQARHWMDFENQPRVVEKMNMHGNYDRIVAGAEFFHPFYLETFRTTEERLLNYGLPRIDHIIQSEESNREKIFKKYPQFLGKKVVLYAPTFKPYDDEGPKQMVEEFLDKDLILVVAIHPKQNLSYEVEAHHNIYRCEDFTIVDLLAACDYLVTDYSAVCLEAAIISKKLLFFLNDHARYLESTGLNLDPMRAMESCCFDQASTIYEVIATDNYDNEALERFRKNYLPRELGTSTKKIVDYLEKYWR